MLRIFFFSFMYDKGEREDSNNSTDIGQEASSSWQITFLEGEYLIMVKEDHENDHDIFYSYIWMTTERSDHVLVSSGPNVVD